MPHEAENEMQRRMEILAEHLESLERRTRWLRWAVASFGIGALIGAGGWLLGRMGTKPRSLPGVAEVVRTHRLVIVDQAGRERAEFTVEPDHNPHLLFYGSSEAPCALLGVHPDGRPGLYLVNAGKRCVELGVRPDGRSGLAVLDRAGKERAVLGIEADGRTFLALRDEEGKLRAGMGVSSGGQPGLVLMEKEKKTMWKAP